MSRDSYNIDSYLRRYAQYTHNIRTNRNIATARVPTRSAVVITRITNYRLQYIRSARVRVRVLYLTYFFSLIYLAYVCCTVRSVARATNTLRNVPIIKSSLMATAAGVSITSRRRRRRSGVFISDDENDKPGPPALRAAELYTHTSYTLMCYYYYIAELHYITLFHHRGECVLQIASSHSDKLNNSP
jgi:hypothetical protein